MRVTLKVTAGPHEGQEFSFEEHDNFLVGRSKRAHFRLPTKDRYFSRIHFMVEVNPPHCRVMDMCSRNGTFLNGERVKMADLKDGDEIKAGRTMLRVTVRGTVPTPGTDDMAPDTIQPPADNPTLEMIQPAGLAAAAVPPVSLMDAPTVLPGDLKAPAALPPSLPPSLPPVPQPAPSATSSSIWSTPRAPAVEPVATPVVAAPRPESHPVVSVPAVSACRACGTAFSAADRHGPVDMSAPSFQELCLACLDRIRCQPQPIPGYHVLRELGRGGMGVVYLAVRAQDGSLVALKTIIPAVSGTKTQLERFFREASILRELNHPHIVAFRDMGEAEGRLFFAMDYVKGIDAAALLRQEGPLPVGRAVTLACQLLAALDFAHERGFVHRDIKPGNMLVTEVAGRDYLKLADFGLARTYQTSQISGLTMSGEIGGTLAYMAPEQITNYREAQPSVDQYAAGATLYNLLTNRYIFDMSKDVRQQILTILQRPPVAIQERRPDVPAGLADVIMRSLAKDPQHRYPDASAMRQALARFQG